MEKNNFRQPTNTQDVMSSKPKKFTLINSEIRLEPTNRCNGKCIMCPREKMKRPQGVMDLKLYKRIVDEAYEAGAQQIFLGNYGETFLDPFIFERAAYAKAKGMEIFAITNASLLDQEKCKKVLELFDVIRISMYGITKDVYEKIHAGLNFELVQENTRRLIALRKESKTSKTRIEMYFLLMEENKHQMQDFLKIYEPKVGAVSVWKPHNWGDGRRYREPRGKKLTCNRPFIGPFQVQWDGMAVPCCFDYDSRIILGDLNKQTVYEVLSGEKYNQLRQAHKEGNFSKFPFCNVCDQLNKRDDVLVYTNIKKSKVGATNTTYFDLKEEK